MLKRITAEFCEAWDTLYDRAQDRSARGEGGMADFCLSSNPYEGTWTMKVNWSDDHPCIGEGNTELEAVQDCLKKLEEELCRGK